MKVRNLSRGAYLVALGVISTISVNRIAVNIANGTNHARLATAEEQLEAADHLVCHSRCIGLQSCKYHIAYGVES